MYCSGTYLSVVFALKLAQNETKLLLLLNPGLEHHTHASLLRRQCKALSSRS